jgi:hypothetical protein
MILMMIRIETVEVMSDDNLHILTRMMIISSHKQITIQIIVVFRSSPEFHPSNDKFQGRSLRRYHINNGKTELIILQGDILTTKVDAIVNGLYFLLKKRNYYGSI